MYNNPAQARSIACSHSRVVMESYQAHNAQAQTGVPGWKGVVSPSLEFHGENLNSIPVRE